MNYNKNLVKSNLLKVRLTIFDIKSTWKVVIGHNINVDKINTTILKYFFRVCHVYTYCHTKQNLQISRKKNRSSFLSSVTKEETKIFSLDSRTRILLHFAPLFSSRIKLLLSLWKKINTLTNYYTGKVFIFKPVYPVYLYYAGNERNLHIWRIAQIFFFF